MEEETKRTEEQIETKISRAMRARVKDFKAQADSLTLEGVRRALEKDLGMETLSLDVHKRVIKQCLEECFYGGDDIDLSTTTGGSSGPCPPQTNEEISGVKDEPQEPKDPNSSSADINENAEESPGIEGMPHNGPLKPEDPMDMELNENKIKIAIKKRRPYFRANLDKMTLGKVRRLLEEDLNLQKNTLDTYKRFISDVLDEVLQSSESADATNGINKKPKKASKGKETGNINREPKTSNDASGSSNMDSDMIDSDADADEVKRPKKRTLQKSKSSMKSVKRQKRSLKESRPSSSRKKKQEEPDVESRSESDAEKSPENDLAPSSSEETPKKQEKPTAQAYGKHVEHLKSVIKACGMGVPPAVYKRAKQAPEGKREAFLIKELEEILAKEGLSTNPSEKDIKAVKKKKERARELEGIDMSNIVSTSRRRSTFNYIPTPKPVVDVESDEDEEGEGEEDDDEGTEDGDNENGESSEGSEEGADESD